MRLQRERDNILGEKFISFFVEENNYAIPLDQVSRIIRCEDITQVPRAPRFVLGVINLQGEVVPVVNLRERFGLSEVEQSVRRRIIVANIAEKRYGIVVDGVREIVEIEEDQIEHEVTSVFGDKADYTSGIAKMDNRLLIILDLVSVLNAP